MPDLLAPLTQEQRARLLEDLNYLNLEEIRSFCSARGIPYKIVAESPDGTVRTTKDSDRKPVVLQRLRHFLATGEAGEPTCFPVAVVRQDLPPVAPKSSDRLYYRWYAKEHAGVLGTLRELTGGRFVDGAVARVLVTEYWTRGEAPTLSEFARAWVDAKTEEHKLLTPEYAYLTDLKRRRANADWKRLRERKAQSALATLDRISPVPPQAAGL